ncbi:MAG: TonB-dependent receptor [Bacteroidota bacterium]
MRNYLLVTFILSVFISFSQQIQVLEEETNLPISGVAIFNLKKSKSVITDIDGRADLAKFSDSEMILFQNILYYQVSIQKSELRQSNFKVILIPKIEDLNQVVISASRFKQNKRDIPQSIVSIDANDVKFQTPQTSADMLENTGNIYVQKSQLGGGSPMIRGFSTNRLLITVDGVRMNNAIFRGGNLQNVISIDPFTLQNTEITLGAGSVVYGSDAIGGVMSFYTKKPKLSYTDSLEVQASAIGRYASANFEKTGHFDVNLGIKKWAFLSSISYSGFDDLKMGSHGPDDYLRPEYIETVNGVDVVIQNEDPRVQVPTGYDQLNLMQKIHFEPRGDLNFDFGLHYSTTSEFSRYDRLNRMDGDNLRSAEWNYGPQRWFLANLQMTKLSSNSNFYDKIQANISYQNFQESRFDRDFQSEIRNIREEAVDAYSFNLDMEKRLSSKNSFYYGLEYIYNKVNSVGFETNISSGLTSPTVSRYPNGADWQSIAAYFSYKYKPSNKLVLQTGLRYNHIAINASFEENNQFLNLPFEGKNLDNGALTGSAGISWMPNEMIHWRVNASTAFRAPNIDDIGKVFDSEPGSVVVPNQNLRPEYAYGGELGLTLNFNAVFKLDLATYYTFLDDALVRRDFTLSGESEIDYDGEPSNVQAIQNASKAWIYGLEVGAEINFSKSFKLTSQYNIIGGTEDNDGIEVPVRHIAPNFGNTHLIWNSKKLKLDAFAEYNNELSFNQLAPSEIEKDFIYALDSNGNPFSPSWYTLNFRSQYQVSKSIDLIATLENITDQRYRPYSSGISAPGRNLIFSVIYNL